MKPVKIIQKSRDSQRYADINNLTVAVNSYLANDYNFEGLDGLYTSNNVSFSNDETRKKVDGSGWIGLNFNQMTNGSPMESLPLDPLNNNSYFYSFAVSVPDKTYEFNCFFENSENMAKASSDNGNNSNTYEIGTDLNLID